MSFVPTTHTNPAFNELLGTIGEQVTKMATLCEKALATACEVINKNNLKLARSIADHDNEINELESDIGLSVATALARHHPVAHDLHALMGSVKMAQELERLADHAKNIGLRAAWLAKYETTVAFEKDVLALASHTHGMLKEFLAATAADDTERAVKVWKRDKSVNDIYMQIMKRALAGESKDNPQALINTIFIAKNFERIGDKIKNLTEIVNYQKTGETVDFDELEDDEEAKA